VPQKLVNFINEPESRGEERKKLGGGEKRWLGKKGRKKWGYCVFFFKDPFINSQGVRGCGGGRRKSGGD